MSADPWVHEYLLAQARCYAPLVGSDVTVHRYSQRPVTGRLLRIAAATLVISGYGVVPVAEVEAVEKA